MPQVVLLHKLVQLSLVLEANEADHKASPSCFLCLSMGNADSIVVISELPMKLQRNEMIIYQLPSQILCT